LPTAFLHRPLLAPAVTFQALTEVTLPGPAADGRPSPTPSFGMPVDGCRRRPTPGTHGPGRTISIGSFFVAAASPPQWKTFSFWGRRERASKSPVCGDILPDKGGGVKKANSGVCPKIVGSPVGQAVNGLAKVAQGAGSALSLR